ncbi:aryl-sulfate sulfotransferase [bacterium]|nr:aryl-sulfate sulfotransferase [bacterium]
MRNIHTYISISVMILYASVLTARNDPGFQYLYPRPGMKHVSSQAEIVIRWTDILPAGIDPVDSCVLVRDEKGQRISGHTSVAADGRTLIFKPDKGFPADQRIRAEIMPGAAGSMPTVVEFTTCKSEQIDPAYASDQTFQKPGSQLSSGQPGITQTGVSVPSDFPHIDISVNDNPDPGFIFLNNWGDQPYNVIFNNSGAPIWYKRTPDRRRDFKVQLNGNLTMLVREGYPFGMGFIALNSNYEEVATYDAVNGYGTDEHELQVLEDGTYLLLGVRSVTVDMSQIVPGGKKEARVVESALQMFTPSGECILQFAALDNFNPADMIGFSPDDQPTDNTFRFPHMNSIGIDDDGHIILSSKRISEVTKINRNTGEIIWRLGGANNEFQFINDPLNGFSSQHSVRPLGNGHYTVFDNGCLHSPQVSRALEYELDTDRMTATLVWQFVEDPPTYAYHMGNVQRLPNGNTLINWAVSDLPKLTEVRPDGSKAFEMNFVNHYTTYRVFKFPWEGIAKKPYLLAESQLDNITLLINQFGDADVDYYRIYGGLNKNPTTLIDTSRLSLKRLTNLENRNTYYFRATSVDKEGNESAYSNEESILVNIVIPGNDMVLNGDFQQSEDHWIWEITGGASADYDTDSGSLEFIIRQSGNQLEHIALAQSGFLLIQGRNYVIGFDAWAVSPRNIEVIVGKHDSPYTNYSKIGETYLTQKLKHFSYQFTMTDPTDSDSWLMIHAGGSEANVFIDNISLIMEDATDISESTEPVLSDLFELKPAFPNPFNSRTRLNYILSHKADIELDIYNILGQQINRIGQGNVAAGNHTVFWDGTDHFGQTVSSGIYICILKSENRIFRQKMLLVR